MKTTSDSPASLPGTRRLLGLTLLSLAISSPMLMAQDKKKEGPPPVCFIRIANTVAPGTGNVKVLVDGSDVYEPGYKFGAVTGGIGLTPGNHTVTIRREGV